MENIQKILVISRSPHECRKTFNCGMSLAKQVHAELYVLHTFHNVFGLKGWNLPIPSQMVHEGFQKMQEDTKKEINRMIEKANKDDLKIEVFLREGKFIDEVTKVVEEKKIDFIVLVSHSEWRLEHFLFGRDNEDVLRKLPCSVLFVKDDPEPVE